MRAGSSTFLGTGPSQAGDSQPRPPAIDVSASAQRVVTAPSISAAATALSALKKAGEGPTLHGSIAGHAKEPSGTSPPLPKITTAPSAPTLLTRSSLDGGASGTLPPDRAELALFTYKPSSSLPAVSQPSPLPSSSALVGGTASPVIFSHAALPWPVSPGEYMEIRRIRRPVIGSSARNRGMGADPNPARQGGEALKGVAKGSGRDGYVFKVGEDAPQVPANQIQVPDSVASAFNLQHRREVEILRVSSGKGVSRSRRQAPPRRHHQALLTFGWGLTTTSRHLLTTVILGLIPYS